MPVVLPHLRTLVDSTYQNDGCIAYGVAEDPFDPGLIRFSELWPDDESLTRHLQAPHIERGGSAHQGVYGRRAGRAPGYEYSTALGKSKVVWTERNLNTWLSNLEGFIPVQKMGFSVLEVRDRADLIAYFKTLWISR
jgi:hypothetical protein